MMHVYRCFARRVKRIRKIRKYAEPLIYLRPATVHGVVFEVLFAAAKSGTLLAGFSMVIPARRQHLELSRKA
ncbi:MAG: hypothetical protein JF604_16005 [Bradyrhizobium sp.]|jgi:hypothetical protein|nr:hypothetical protein [Bradyrhizobium sp.]